MSKIKENINKELKVTPIYILSLEAAWFTVSEGDSKSDEVLLSYNVPEIKTINQFYKYYSGSISDNLDLQQLLKVDKDIIQQIKLNKRKKSEVIKTYSNAIIDISFDKDIVEKDKSKVSYFVENSKYGYQLKKRDYKLGDILYNKKELKDLIYNNGFTITFNSDCKDDTANKIKTIKYVHYKRSANKSKTGSCLFIREDLYSDIMNWTYMGMFDKIPVDIPLDLASLLAYESLSLSGLEGTVKINPDNILLVKDLISPEFEVYQSVSRDEEGTESYSYYRKPYSYNRKLKNGEIKTIDVNGRYITGNRPTINLKCENEWRKIKNICSDGECLLDSSIFEENNLPYGVLLLRQKFFKSAALNTDIQGFYKDYCKNNNTVYDDTTVFDMFGNTKKMSEIKMIVCPSSFKLFKFSSLFFPNDIKNIDESKQKSNKDCWDYWCNYIKSKDNDNCIFGVVKHEKPSQYGNGVNVLSYQFLNSLPFSSKDQLKEVLKYDFDYIIKLKNDIEFFKKHISQNNNQNDFEEEEINTSRDYILTMLKMCPDFYKTQLFKDFRHDTVENYRKNMRKGKVKVTTCDYAVQFGNVYELLLSTVKEITDNDVLHKGRQCYCPAIDNGEGIALFRSPHINSGNVMYATNVYKDEFRYFNLNNNIIIVNCWDNDHQDRTQGSDFDIDQLLYCNQSTIVTLAKQCDIIAVKGQEAECKYPTPVKVISNDTTKSGKLYSLTEMANIDNKIANNLIGFIVNSSQIFNTYYWDILFNNPKNKDDLDECYTYSSICSSLSQIEIDKSKKEFKNLNTKRIVNKMLSDKLFKKSSRYKEKNCFTVDEVKAIVGNDFKDDAKSLYLSKKDISMIPEQIKIEEITKLIKPEFFRYCSIDKNVDYKDFDCPMDWLQQILSDEFPRVNNYIDSIDIMSLLVKDNQKVNYDQIRCIYDIVSKYKSNVGAIYKSYSQFGNVTTENKKADRQKELNNELEQTINKLNDLTIRPSTIYYIFYIIYGKEKNDYFDKDKYRRVAKTMIGLLYQAKPELLKSVFKNVVFDENSAA